MEIEALLKTMMDELKDAQMMYDYACGSKKYGHDDLMTFYITRAEQRLKMFDEDHAIILREIGKKEKEGYFGNGIIFMTITWIKNAIQLIKSKILNK